MISYRGHRGPFRVGLLVFAVASWRLLLTTGTETDTLPSLSIGGEHSNSNDGPLKSDTVSPGIAQVASTGTRSPQDDSSDGNGRNLQSSGSRANAVWEELLEARGHPPCSNPPFKEVSSPMLVLAPPSFMYSVPGCLSRFAHIWG